jgi:uncharacterized protein (DUF1499 family)
VAYHNRNAKTDRTPENEVPEICQVRQTLLVHLSHFNKSENAATDQDNNPNSNLVSLAFHSKEASTDRDTRHILTEIDKVEENEDYVRQEHLERQLPFVVLLLE